VVTAVAVPVPLPVPGAALVSEDAATPDDCECISGRGGPSRTSAAYAATVISLRTLVPLANGRGHG
jgi:hypothetical protein